MQELTWTNEEGLKLHAIHWPVEMPKAVIALVHGQGEHIGRYHHLAAWYNRQEIAVVGYDQQGYGKSEGPRGHAKSVDALLDDIGLLLNKVRSLYPDVPRFLYGHSMGGNLSLNYALKRQPNIKGLIVTGPQIRLSFEPPAIKIWVGKFMRSIVPSLALPTGLPVDALSRDKAVVEAYKADPLVHDKLSAAEGIGILEAGAWLDKYSGTAPVPMLLQHGSDDQITSAAGTRDMAERLKGDVTYKEWPGMYHEIHNEADQEAVFGYTLAWLTSKLGVSS